MKHGISIYPFHKFPNGEIMYSVIGGFEDKADIDTKGYDEYNEALSAAVEWVTL